MKPQHILFVVMMMISSMSSATRVFVAVEVLDSTGYTERDNTNSPGNSISFSSTGYSASATGDINAGTMRGSASSSSGDTDTSHFAFFSSALRYDNIVFSPGASGIGYLAWHWDGSSTSKLPTNLGADAAATLGILIRNDTSAVRINISEDHVLTPSACNGAHNSCTVGQYVNESGFTPFTISSDGSYLFQEYLSGFATAGTTSDFLHTGTLSLLLPKGVTYTSASGQFVPATPTTPSNSVPEPSPLLLIGLGIFGLALLRKKVFGVR